MKRTFLASLLAFSTLWMAMPSWAQSGSEHTVQELVTLFSAYSNQRANQNILDAAAKRIDYSAMVELMLQPAQWNALAVTERRQISAQFRKLVEQRYYPRWHKIFGRAKLNIAGEVKAGSDVYVKTFLLKPGDEDAESVVWRIRPHGADGSVINVDVNGKDLIARLAPRFQKTLQKRGSDGLIAWMKERSNEDADEDLAAR